ncbi:heavy metal translocating P-type ATPase [Arthrobacter halodurans]|uniref:Heavy metal translocating P-type ATPase n=1 Tax=Arthrobacter halodurans TaxID=516699 RepID=A0ABV4USL4_9MICC
MQTKRALAAVRRYPIVAATVAVGVVVTAFALVGREDAARWTASVFALTVAALVGYSMVRDLLRGHWGIDVLAFTAILATVAVGEYAAALIICLMLSGGEALEDYAGRRAKRELTALLERAPRDAHRILEDGTVSDVGIEAVEAGDLLLVRPSEVVPVDGVLRSAVADFDESSLTGESLPVTRHTGDDVMSGVLNGARAIRLEARARAADSQYSRIIALVREAAASRAPVVRLADRYAVPFTLFAFLVGGMAWWLSGDPVRFAEVLVVATPCPLLIAAPVAFMGGMSRAAGNGIIVKSGGTIEMLANVRTAAFDKTGTLTYGRPELLAVLPAGGPGAATPRGLRLDADPEPLGARARELLQLAASAEQYSSHVLAHSVMGAAKARGLELLPGQAASESATNGVVATVAGRSVLVGKELHVRNHASGVEHYDLGPGEMAVYVAVDGRFAGVLVMSDRVRDDARSTLAELGRLGVVERLMLTGDQRGTADHIAAQVGLTRVLAECLPEDKVVAIREAPARPVMMVGDGVNDAPVLAAAEVGVAMGARGSTAASESADVVIVTDDLFKTATAVGIGQRTVRVALQSIWIGIALSVVLMLVAATGVLPAVAGALMQELVDLVTILNALRALGPTRGPRAGGRV